MRQLNTAVTGRGILVRFLFTTLPEPGHFHPLIPIARAVVRAGHEVAFGCAASFIPEVEAAGFQGFAVGHDQQGRHYSEDHPEWLAVPPDQRSMWMIRNLWADEWARVMVTDLLSLSQTWMPDVVVREGAEYGGCIAAEILRIPHASVRAGRISSSYAHRHAAAEQLVRLRSERGLPPDPDMRMLHRYLYLACEPPGFHEADEPQAPTMHRLRPVVEAPGSDGGAPAWLDNALRPSSCFRTRHHAE